MIFIYNDILIIKLIINDICKFSIKSLMNNKSYCNKIIFAVQLKTVVEYINFLKKNFLIII